MGTEVFIFVILACVIGLCFLGNRLNRTADAEALVACSESQEAVSNASDIRETDRNEQEQSRVDMKEEEKKEETPNEEETKPDTIGLMYDTLCSIGCQPTKDDEDTLSVQYQGEDFFMRFGGMFAIIWDPLWFAMKADDPELPTIKEAINATNFNFGPTVVFSSPNEEGMIGIHSRRDIMLHPTCPDNELYVKSVLDSFFEKKNDVKGYFHKIKSEQTESLKKRRPVGFATDVTTE